MAEYKEHLGQQVGEYRLCQQLGKGSFGTVYLAEHLHDHSQAAVKLLRFQITNREDLKDFLNEARTMMRLHHPHIVPLLDFSLMHDDTPYLVMEYAAGGTLRQHYPKGTKLPLKTIDTYVTQLASALEYAHNHRVIHRDVKPENILLRTDGTILLSDFGIAKVLEQSSFVSLQTLVGTPAYMAPEQSRGKPCPASDQYALAITIYEWLAGQLPFQGSYAEVIVQHRLDMPPSLQELCPEVPIQVEQVVLQALAKMPEERFSSIEQFAEVLHAALQVPSSMDLITQPCDEPVSTLPITIAPQPSIQPLPYSELSITNDQAAPSVLSEAFLSQIDGGTQPELDSASPHSLQIPPSPVGEIQKLLPALLAPSAEAQITQGNQPQESSFQPPSVADKLLTTQHSQALSPAHTVAVAFHPRNNDQNRSRVPTKQSYAVTPRSHNKRFAKGILVVTVLCFVILLVNITWVWTVTQRYLLDASATAYNTDIATMGIQFGFDAQHTHNNPYEHILTPSTVTHLAQAWTAQTGGPVYSSPAVANGIVYIGSYDHKLYAFKADGCGQATCAPLWTAPTSNTVASSPAVVNGVVYVGSYDHKLYAFKANGCGQATCAPLWTAQTEGEVVSSPAVANGVVYVGSLDGNLYAFKADGCGQAICTPLWTAPTGGGVSSSPAVANSIVYVGSLDYKLYAFKTDGCGQAICAPLWTASTGGGVTSLPAVANDIVYVGSWDHKLYAFKTDGCGQATCAPLWTAQTGGEVLSSPAVADGVVYVGSYDHKLYAFKTDGCGQATCAPLWTAQTEGEIVSSPAVANGVVYVGSDDHKLYVFKSDGCGQATCAPLWTTQTGNSVSSSPAVANGIVYVGSFDSKLYVFHL